MLARVLTSIVCPSVCPSVTSRHCTKTAKRMITQTTPRDSTWTLVFWRQQSLVGDPQFRRKFALKVTNPPFEHNDLDQYTLTAPQPWELAKKVQLSLIGSQRCAFYRATCEPCALPLSPPKGGSRREFLHLVLPFISSLQVIVDFSNLVCGLQVPAYRWQTVPVMGLVTSRHVTNLIF